VLRDVDFFTKLFSDDVQVYFQQYFEKKGPGDIIENCEEVGFIQLIKVEIKEVKDID